MLTILLGFFDEPTENELKELCNSSGCNIRIYTASATENIFSLCDKIDFHMLLFKYDKNTSYAHNIVTRLRESKKYCSTKILLFSSRIDYLVGVFLQWQNTDFFLLPLTEEKRESLISLLHFYDGMYQKIHANSLNYFLIQTPKKIYKLPRYEILYAESIMKKTVIHLKSKDVPLPYSLNKVKEMLPDSIFLQIHRSFIVNIENISHINKVGGTWEVHFFDSDKTAYVSRSYQKLLPKYYYDDAK